MKLRLALAVLVLLTTLPASIALAGVEVGKVRGDVVIQNAAYGTGTAVVEAREALGVPGDAWYRPASGRVTMSYSGALHDYAIDYVVVGGSQAILSGVDQYGRRMYFRVMDGTPDKIGVGTAMSMTVWTVTGGDLVVKDR